VSASTLTLAEAARMMRELGRAAVKDKSYRRFPLGEEAGRFLRSLRWADASPNTLATYEIVLARLTIDHADLELRDFEPPLGTERVREFSTATGATLHRRHAPTVSSSSRASSVGP
jgi:hypothetical protein